MTSGNQLFIQRHPDSERVMKGAGPYTVALMIAMHVICCAFPNIAANRRISERANMFFRQQRLPGYIQSYER
ncbi:hypothetical protein D3C85_1738510 [compost metagenome]